MRFTYVTAIALIVALVAGPVPAVCLKLAAEKWVTSVNWLPLRHLLEVNGTALLYFVVALGVGIVPPLCITIALRNNKPNVVFATFGAPSVVVMHLTLAVYFENTLTPVQWVGISVIVFGALLLRSAKSDPLDETAAKAIEHLEEDGEVEQEMTE